MKIDKSLEFIKMLKKRMGSDLVYNLFLDIDDEFYVIVSPHKSATRKYKDNAQMHRVHISKNDINKQNFVLCNEINNIFRDLFVDKDNEPTRAIIND